MRGCLSIFNTTNAKVVIPPDNGDVTGLQSFTTRDVEYVVEGGKLRVYDTLIDSLLPPNDFLQAGTIIITGYITRREGHRLFLSSDCHPEQAFFAPQQSRV